MPIHRHFRAMLFCLAIGATINIGIAWYCSLRGNPRSVVLDYSPIAAFPWPEHTPPEWRRGANRGLSSDRGGLKRAVYDSTFHTRFAEPPFLIISEATESFALTQFRAGWPLRSMAWSSATCKNQLRALPRSNFSTFAPPVSKPVACSALFEGITPSSFLLSASDPLSAERRIPIRPLPLPFLVNSLAFGAPFAVVLFTGAFVRQFHRKRHNRCPTCAYPLDNLARCPECGTPA